MTELLDLVGPYHNRRKDIKGEARVILEAVEIGRVETGQARSRQSVAPVFALCASGLELITQRHQFIESCNDAMLFGKRRKCNRNTVHAVLGRPPRPAPVCSFITND